jgi:membrane fusion protein, multidrug efflux system
MMKHPDAMTKTFKYVSDMKILIGILLFIAVMSCNEKQQNTSLQKEEAKSDSVKSFILKKDSVQKTISLPGDLYPDENIQIRAKVYGYIKKLNADIGSRVRKGQVLALIDAPEINSHVQELNENVSAAKARFLSSKDYYDRIYIASKTEGVIAGNELEQRKNQMAADSSEYKAAVFASSSYKQIGHYLAIIAPVSGIITKRNIDVGSFVGNANEKPLFELDNNSTLRLRVAIPEIYTGATLLNNTGELTTRSLPDKRFKTQLARKSGSIDNETRSEIWEFEMPNSDHQLLPGSYADVKLHFIRPQRSFVAPTSAVVTTLERKFVIKVSDGTTKWVDVRAGFNMGDKQEIFGDLNEGDTLILKSSEELKEGKNVIPAIQSEK